MAREEGYPKAVRLRRRRDFITIQREGRRRHTLHFVVIRRPAASGSSRLGVTVSARVGNAVVRNRIKRMVREVFRRQRRRIGTPGDFVVIAKPGADQVAYAEAARELEHALELAAAG